MFVKLATIVMCLSYIRDVTTVTKSSIVQTNNGAIFGGEDTTSRLGVPYYFYKNIPYGEAPIGSLRFMSPVPKDNWEGTLDGTIDGPQCFQSPNLAGYGSEDCLNLNIYTPKDPAQPGDLLPVLFWIYGGGFMGGNASYALYGPDNFMEKNIMVVTVNYRLGVLGFASTGDAIVPGNAGIKDQLLALKWVNTNIRSFGGDPEKVTLAGQSAGSVATGYLRQAPKAQAAILESGVPLCPFGFSRDVPKVLKDIATKLGISTTNSSTMVQKLQEVDSIELQNATSSVLSTWPVTNNPRNGLPLGPVAEFDNPDAIFTGGTYSLLENGNFSRVPTMLGFTSLEGTHEFDLKFKAYLLLTFDGFPKKMLPIDAKVTLYKQQNASLSIKDFYFGSTFVAFSEDIKLMQYLSDDQFVKSIVQYARLIQKYASTYLYHFSYEGGLWGIYQRNHSGVTHSEELGYLWKTNFAPQRPHDLVVSNRIVTLWSNFVKFLNPTPVEDPLLQNTIWPSFGSQQNYLDIGHDLVVGQHVSQPNISFWDDWYAIYGNPPYSNTY